MPRPFRPSMVVVTCGGLEMTRWPLARAGRADLAVADQLARCQLVARRVGCAIELLDTDDRLREVLDLLGFWGVVLPRRGVGHAGSGPP